MKHLVLLIVISYLNFAAESEASLIRCNQAVQDFKDGSLPGAVVSDHGHFLSTLNGKVKVRKETGPGIRFGKTADGKDVVPA